MSNRELIRNTGNTIVRSIRIDGGLEDSLSKIAREKDVTPNSLITSALTKYVEWDDQIERYRYVTLPEEQLRGVIEALTTRQAKLIGARTGPRLVKELLQFRFKKVSIEYFVELMRYLSRYSGIARCEVDSDSGWWTLTYRHQLGGKWSAFSSAFYSEALKELFSAQVQSDWSESQVILRWSIPASGGAATQQ